jgi:hypothetical protein
MLLLLIGAAMVATLVAADQRGLAVIAGLTCLGLAFVVSPLFFPSPLTAVEAQRRSADDGRPIVYWRPGCPFCMKLRLRLGRAGSRLHWVDIWRDPAGAAAVRRWPGETKRCRRSSWPGRRSSTLIRPGCASRCAR